MYYYCLFTTRCLQNNPENFVIAGFYLEVRLDNLKMGKRVFVVGVGMTNFEKPGKRPDFDYPDMVR